MLSYQHSFHAGNHADVLKHITLCAVLRKLLIKPKPFFYLDTHAGSGCYEVEDDVKHDPVVAASLPLQDDTPEVIKRYLGIVQAYLAKSSYPGSPLIVSEAIASFADGNEPIEQAIVNANMHLSELHPSAFETLKMWMRSSSFHSHQRDGFELLNALLPPKPNRGLVLIDPPYEQAKEYDQVVHSVLNAIKKWPNGIFCVWYPLLSPERIDRKTQDIEYSPKHGFSEGMLSSLTDIAKAANIGLLDVKFANQSPSTDVGMYGSGMAIFNPPWQLESDLQESLLYLCEHLKFDSNELSGINWLAPAP